MIRFVDLRNQGTYHRFAFWNTVVSKFIDLEGDQAWDSEEDLVESFKLCYGESGNTLLERLKGLMPDWAKIDDGKGEEKW